MLVEKDTLWEPRKNAGLNCRGSLLRGHAVIAADTTSETLGGKAKIKDFPC